MVEFTEVEAPASEAQIQAFERKIGYQFPPRLRRLFLEANGGRPNPYLYRDEKNDTDVSQCLALREGRGSLQDYYDLIIRQRRQLPEHFVPFAVDSGGDFYFVDCNSANGLVSLYVHDTALDHHRPLNVTIDEFFEKLTDEE